MMIRTGFQVECDPAGVADLRIEGDLDIGAMEDVIQLLEMIVRRLHAKIQEADAEKWKKPVSQ